MTGIGRAEAPIADRRFSVEIKSLNGKSLDLNLNKLAPALRSWELDLRRYLAARVLRGTVDLTVAIRQDTGAQPAGINKDLATSYFQTMRDLAQSFGISQSDPELLTAVLRLPDVIQSTEVEPLNDEDWQVALQLIGEAVDKLMVHRRTEGSALEADLLSRIDAIEAGVQKILPLEAGRIDRVKTRIMNSLRESSVESKDPNRFEQELIYYLEKMDISEEKTRLAQHCRYFREVVANEELSKGKVLAFILQEIGREINTLGAKANEAGIQQIVVSMKDELEKAKEQVLNVL